ncbi:ORF6N domain-containing protein [Ferruginibacter paludis]|uniref:ORF6N domain-containing protein n=1 Tax=Ferruginibacter paludis TaxID=1310417 RepID=UPI0025B608E4|nr:ORF6N domain-containing protein [Ferruginibacter paludis]MDN3656634.1 ORF6N domain-containing protein [Ferruginibacter paludis]
MAKPKSLTVIAEEKIVNQIHLIRGQKVMLDSDLAALYGVETKRLKEQVNRNLSRFPKHYMFELTKEEYDNLRSQIATLKQGGHTKYLPYAFTEHGILMLANVLKSARAIEMSIKVIDVFVKLREMLLTHTDILLKLELLEKQVVKNSGEIQTIFSVLKQLLNPPREPRRRIGFKPDN